VAIGAERQNKDEVRWRGHRPTSSPLNDLRFDRSTSYRLLGQPARLLDGGDTGPTPTLPAPTRTHVPTVDIAPAERWQEGQMPTAAEGLAVRPFATGLDHPRWLHVLPNGDVLVAETDAPPRPAFGQGIKGWVMKKVMARADAGVCSANRITLLRDADGDGTAETRSVFLQNLDSPFGMTLVGDGFYVANADAVMEYAYNAGQTQISGQGRRLTDLPGGPRITTGPNR